MDVAGEPTLHASRACRIDARDNPGGEPRAFARALNLATLGGVAGTVSNELLPKRHCLPELRTVAEPDDFNRKASRSCRIDARESPGGEATAENAFEATGVAGIVSKGVLPKLQGLLTPWLDSELDRPDALSESEALPLPPISVVSASSSEASIAITPEVFCTRVMTESLLGSKEPVELPRVFETMAS